MDDDIFALLIRHMDAEKLAVAEAMVNGSATDFPEYRRMCGVVRGLELGQRIVGELRQRMQEQDDE